MLPKKRENLLVVCCGDNSLHPLWIPYRESFDILTIYYGEDPQVARSYERGSDLFFRGKGLKISLAREILLNHLMFEKRFEFSDYRYIWFPDDDVKFHEGDEAIEKLFRLAASSRADVFQPAIQNEHFSPLWEATRAIPGVLAHRTNIVELMAHGFSGEIFARCYLSAIHVCEFMQSGWGLEPVWLKIGETLLRRPLRTFVFDAVPIIHTRPIGGGDSSVHKLGSYEATYMPQIHTNRMATLRTYETLQALEHDESRPWSRNAERIESYHAERFREFLGPSWSLGKVLRGVATRFVELLRSPTRQSGDSR